MTGHVRLQTVLGDETERAEDKCARVQLSALRGILQKMQELELNPAGVHTTSPASSALTRLSSGMKTQAAFIKIAHLS